MEHIIPFTTHLQIWPETEVRNFCFPELKDNGERQATCFSLSLQSYKGFTHDQLALLNIGRTLQEEPNMLRDLEKQSL